MYRWSIFNRVMSHEPKLALLARNVQIDRANDGVRTSQGLKAKVDGSSGSSTDICRSQCSPRRTKYSLVQRYGSGDHAKSCPQKGWRYYGDLSALHPMAFNGP
jgi:hypothetical protein